jgi:FkbM family methyltransferase
MASDASSPPDELPATALKECRHGRMLYLRHDQYIGRSLDLYGEFSESEAELFRQIVRPGDVVVEAGANIGAHTVHLAKLVGPRGMVLAFEPQRIIYSLLCANLMLNEQFHVQPFRAAVSDAVGTIRVPVLNPRGRLNSGGLSLATFKTGEPVPVVRLDDYQMPSLRMLKIDVEGMETEVLRGASQTIKKHRPVLYVENDRAEKSADLIRLITELDYQLFWHLPMLFNPRNFAGHSENVFDGVISINMLCVAKETQSVVRGLREVTGPDDTWDSPSQG